jgi:hypothetical protein
MPCCFDLCNDAGKFHLCLAGSHCLDLDIYLSADHIHGIMQDISFSPVNSLGGTDQPEGMMLKYTLSQRKRAKLLNTLAIYIDRDIYELCHKKDIVFYGEKKGTCLPKN